MALRASKKRTAGGAALALLLHGCAGIQSAMDPQGPEAAAIAQATWIMIGAGGAILALVMALALYAVYRSPARRPAVSARTFIIAGGVAFPVVALSALLVYGVALMGNVRGFDGAPDIRIIGHQWWWEVRYGDDAVTANELRLPVGRRMSVALESRDVIHSFWVPNLAGKLDLIPGRVTRMTIRADAAGMFRGQCAEFCGEQHARMALHVTAEPPEAFDRWLAQRAQAPPATLTAHPGHAAFLRHCAECHSVRGVARATAQRPGPDLTHVASRPWLGGGALENSTANRLAFITRNQSVKPGNRMPEFAHLDLETLDALDGFLSRLQ